MIKKNVFYSILLRKKEWDLLKGFLQEFYEISPVNINCIRYLPIDVNIMQYAEEDLEDTCLEKIKKSSFWGEVKKFFEKNKNNELFIEEKYDNKKNY